MREPVPREMQAYYELGLEANRLFHGHGHLELARTQEIILRHLPPPPCGVLDVGGGPGVYARWLATRGHHVALIDASPFHVQQASEASRHHPHASIAECRLGDARRLDVASDSVPVVLLLGPLYHLIDFEDRLQALREANRVLEPAGLLVRPRVPDHDEDAQQAGADAEQRRIPPGGQRAERIAKDLAV